MVYSQLFHSARIFPTHSQLTTPPPPRLGGTLIRAALASLGLPVPWPRPVPRSFVWPMHYCFFTRTIRSSSTSSYSSVAARLVSLYESEEKAHAHHREVTWSTVGRATCVIAVGCETGNWSEQRL